MKEKAEDEQQEAGTRIRAAILAGRVHTAAGDFVAPQERRKSSSGQSGVNNVHVCDGVLTSICTAGEKSMTCRMCGHTHVSYVCSGGRNLCSSVR